MDSVVEIAPPAGKEKKLLDQMRDVLRFKHYSLRTEQTYCHWVERFIRFHKLRHPRTMGELEVAEFLTDLARRGQVAASTQNQALSALLFLYQQVLKQKIGWLENVERAQRPVRLPVVLTPEEVRQVLAHLRGSARLMASLLYGSGLRLMESVLQSCSEKTIRMRCCGHSRPPSSRGGSSSKVIQNPISFRKASNPSRSDSSNARTPLLILPRSNSMLFCNLNAASCFVFRVARYFTSRLSISALGVAMTRLASARN